MPRRTPSVASRASLRQNDPSCVSPTACMYTAKMDVINDAEFEQPIISATTISVCK